MAEQNEQLAAQAFSNQSPIFDEIYSGNTIVQYKRERVRNHVNKFLPAHSHILELNSGTGEDATYFAANGHTVHATDISASMQQQLIQKVLDKGLQDRVTNELCSFTELQHLKNKGPYDLIFSNFAGLNCTRDLGQVLCSLSPLLKANGLVTLVVLPPFCLWETLLIFKGHFKTALRRFNSKKGITAHVEGVHFTCWYYKPSFISKTLKDEFEVLSVEGLCTIVPPSYIEHFPEKHPKAYSFLKKWEEKLKYRWPWRNIGDYYIITLKKR